MHGDKSISHRSVLVGAICDGHGARSRASARTADTRGDDRAPSARSACSVDEIAPTTLRVHGVGLRGLEAPAGADRLRNAGTLLRLLPGLLAGQPEGTFTLDGDESLRRRPMERIAEPLGRMGAVIAATDGRAPLHHRRRRPAAPDRPTSCRSLARR